MWPMHCRFINRLLKGSSNEHGFALVLAVASLAALLSLVGLAIDTANLMHSRRILQNAVNAAAMDGSRMALTNISDSDLTDYIRNVAARNLEANGIAVGNSGEPIHDAIFGSANTPGSGLVIKHGTVGDQTLTASADRDWVQVQSSIPVPMYILYYFVNSSNVTASALANNIRYDISFALDVWGPARWVKYVNDSRRPSGCAGNGQGVVQGGVFNAGPGSPKAVLDTDHDCHVGLDMARYITTQIRKMLTPADYASVILAGGSPAQGVSPNTYQDWSRDCKYWNPTNSTWTNCGASSSWPATSAQDALFSVGLDDQNPQIGSQIKSIDTALDQIRESSVEKFDAGWSEDANMNTKPKPIDRSNDYNNPAAAIWGARLSLASLDDPTVQDHRANYRRVIIFVSPGNATTDDGNTTDGVVVPGGPNALPTSLWNPATDPSCPVAQRNMLDQTILASNSGVDWSADPTTCFNSPAPNHSKEGNEMRRRKRMLEMIHEGDLARGANISMFAIYPDASSDAIKFRGATISHFNPQIDDEDRCSPFQSGNRWPSNDPVVIPSPVPASSYITFSLVKPLALIRTVNDKSQLTGKVTINGKVLDPTLYGHASWDFPCMPSGSSLKNALVGASSLGVGGKAFIGNGGDDFEDKFGQLLHGLDAGRVWLSSTPQ